MEFYVPFSIPHFRRQQVEAALGSSSLKITPSHQCEMYATQPVSDLSYAPTPPYSQIQYSSLSARINLDEEVKLAGSIAERDLIDSLAEIYSIIRTLDGLEKAYITDAVTEAEYTEICSKLLKQYRSLLNDEGVTKEFVDLDTFCRKWDVRGERRLNLL